METELFCYPTVFYYTVLFCILLLQCCTLIVIPSSGMRGELAL